MSEIARKLYTFAGTFENQLSQSMLFRPRACKGTNKWCLSTYKSTPPPRPRSNTPPSMYHQLGSVPQADIPQEMRDDASQLYESMKNQICNFPSYFNAESLAELLDCGNSEKDVTDLYQEFFNACCQNWGQNPRVLIT